MLLRDILQGAQEITRPYRTFENPLSDGPSRCVRINIHDQICTLKSELSTATQAEERRVRCEPSTHQSSVGPTQTHGNDARNSASHTRNQEDTTSNTQAIPIQ